MLYYDQPVFTPRPWTLSMTKRIINNSLYTHLKSVINQALPLEYAIRSVRKTNPRELELLSEIDKRIRQYWIALGMSEAEIDAESLMDFAWDRIQIGFPLTRRHGRVYPDSDFLELIYHGLAGVWEEFGTEVEPLRIPATRYFRICDLLNGNDILGLLNAVHHCLQDAQGYGGSDVIELKKFVRGIREPIHLHPGLEYVGRHRSEGDATLKSFGITLDLETEFSMPDLQRQIREFLYQYAIWRESPRPALGKSDISGKLINAFLRDEMYGRIYKHKVTRHDGFFSILSGLYCWDLVQKYRQERKKSAVDNAIVDTQAIYPKGNNIKEVGEEAIRKNYNTARVAINKVSFAL